MQVKELIEVLQCLTDDEKEFMVAFEDRKNGLHIMSGRMIIRRQPRVIGLLSRDDPPEDLGVGDPSADTGITSPNPSCDTSGAVGEPDARREEPQNFWQL